MVDVHLESQADVGHAASHESLQLASSASAKSASWNSMMLSLLLPDEQASSAASGLLQWAPV